MCVTQRGVSFTGVLCPVVFRQSTLLLRGGRTSSRRGRSDGGAVIVIDSDNTAPARPVKPVPAGRPALGADKRTRRVNLSVNERELEALRALAEREGATSLSRWVRDRVLTSLDGRASTGGDVAREIARLRADLNRVGNNVNQVAHVLNAANLWNAAPPEDLRVLESIEEVRRVLGDIRAWTSEHT